MAKLELKNAKGLVPPRVFAWPGQAPRSEDVVETVRRFEEKLEAVAGGNFGLSRDNGELQALHRWK